MTTKPTRRDFLKRTAAAAAGSQIVSAPAILADANRTAEPEYALADAKYGDVVAGHDLSFWVTGVSTLTPVAEEFVCVPPASMYSTCCRSYF